MGVLKGERQKEETILGNKFRGDYGEHFSDITSVLVVPVKDNFFCYTHMVG